jgi:hypothetical protein
LEIRERVLGPEDPDTVWTFTNLAWVLRWLGEFPASRRLWERSLAIREKVLGPEHLDTAWSLKEFRGIGFGSGSYAGRMLGAWQSTIHL